MLSKQLEFIVRGSEVKRFHAVKTIGEETVGAHSFLVAMLCHLLDPNGHLLILAALTHDLAEQHTGDIPANTKLSLGISEQVALLEAGYLQEVAFDFPLSKESRRALKIADMLAGMIFCKRQALVGNQSLDIIYSRYSKYLEGLAPFTSRELEVINAVSKL